MSKRYKPRAVEANYLRAQREAKREYEEGLKPVAHQPAVETLIFERLRWLAPAYLEGVLPHKDFLPHLREILFAPLLLCPRFQKIQPHDLHHAPTCRHTDLLIQYETTTDPALVSPEWDLRRSTVENYLTLRGPVLCTLEGRLHRALCRCGAGQTLASIHVTIEWAGYELTREYSTTPIVLRTEETSGS